MGTRVRLKAGDIFSFELDASRFGVGQVVEPKPSLYITVLRNPVPRTFALADLDPTDILLCGRTMDALFFHGYWHVVGTLPVPESCIPRPCNKVEAHGRRWISDFYAKRLVRRATDLEWERLDYHSARAPIAYQNAFKAHHGLGPMEASYAALGIDHVRAQAAICPP